MSEPTPKAQPSAPAGNRRRSSGFMPSFEGLQQQKNNSDAARRQSMSDQQAKGGMLSQFFHNNFGRNTK
ncbi:hypothetical protein RJ55_00370 [Drechmeria coniospora]|nr:hypothetical protein RJ55_00370 [Drechmeria coniospora]